MICTVGPFKCILNYSSHFCLQVCFSPSTEEITAQVTTLMGQLIGCISGFSRLPEILGKKKPGGKVRERGGEGEGEGDLYVLIATGNLSSD